MAHKTARTMAADHPQACHKQKHTIYQAHVCDTLNKVSASIFTRQVDLQVFQARVSFLGPGRTKRATGQKPSVLDGTTTTTRSAESLALRSAVLTSSAPTAHFWPAPSDCSVQRAAVYCIPGFIEIPTDSNTQLVPLWPARSGGWLQGLNCLSLAGSTSAPSAFKRRICWASMGWYAE